MITLTPPVEARCLECGYSLRELTQPRCPECGTCFDARDPSSFGTAGDGGALLRSIERLAHASQNFEFRLLLGGALATICTARYTADIPLVCLFAWGLAIWMVLVASMIHVHVVRPLIRSKATRQSARPTVLLLVAMLFALSIVRNSGYAECPHAVTLSIGPFIRITIRGRACHNEQKYQPIVPFIGTSGFVSAAD